MEIRPIAHCHADSDYSIIVGVAVATVLRCRANCPALRAACWKVRVAPE